MLVVALGMRCISRGIVAVRIEGGQDLKTWALAPSRNSKPMIAYRHRSDGEAFGCMVPKRAIDRGSRFLEATLLGLSLSGGALGGIVGMRVAHYKTSKWYFMAWLPAFIILHIALFLLAHGAGLAQGDLERKLWPTC